jgi:hypothetical protein
MAVSSGIACSLDEPPVPPVPPSPPPLLALPSSQPVNAIKSNGNPTNLPVIETSNQTSLPGVSTMSGALEAGFAGLLQCVAVALARAAYLARFSFAQLLFELALHSLMDARGGALDHLQLDGDIVQGRVIDVVAADKVTLLVIELGDCGV